MTKPHMYKKIHYIYRVRTDIRIKYGIYSLKTRFPVCSLFLSSSF